MIDRSGPADRSRRSPSARLTALACPTRLARIGAFSILLPALLSDAPAEAASPPAPAGPRVGALRAAILADMSRITDLWVTISEISAPSGKEAARAARMEKEFRDLGLDEVGRDEIGNVMGVLRGRSRGTRRVVYAAHLDTVATDADDPRVARSDPARLRGPGIRDNASGLVGLIEAVRALKGADLLPPNDIWLLASVQEEVGLLGAKKFLDDNSARVARFVAIDGEIGEIATGATGILWLKVHFLSDGAHTLQSRDRPSPTLAAARAVEDVHEITVPREPESRASWLNVSMMGGADVVNATARDAWFTVDVRSNSNAVLKRIADEVRAAGAHAAKKTRVRLKVEELMSLPAIAPLEVAGSPFVALAVEAFMSAGWASPTLTPRGTADHSRALERGIPGIQIGLTTGTGTHTPLETAEIGPLSIGITALALLMATLPADP